MNSQLTATSDTKMYGGTEADPSGNPDSFNGSIGHGVEGVFACVRTGPCLHAPEYRRLRDKLAGNG